MRCDLLIFDENKSTNTRSSLFYIDGEFVCFMIENLEKSIPLGIYEIKERRDYTPLTERFAAKYEWFGWFAEIQVPDRTGMYIHIANSVVSESSKRVLLSGCVAPVSWVDTKRGFGGESEQAHLRFYAKMAEHLANDTALISISYATLPVLF